MELEHRVMGASRCALRVLFFAMCRGLSAGFIVASPGCARPVVSRRIPACNAAVDLTESYPTLTALWGLLALVPLTRLDAKRLNKIERLEGTAAIAETAFGLLGSMTVFLTSRFELEPRQAVLQERQAHVAHLLQKRDEQNAE